MSGVPAGRRAFHQQVGFIPFLGSGDGAGQWLMLTGLPEGRLRPFDSQTSFDPTC